MRLALVSAVAVLLLTPQAAAGGGWWSNIRLDRTVAAPGQRVEVSATVTVTAVERPYYVYLLRGYDYSALEQAMRVAEPGNWWALRGAEATPVAPVAVSDVDDLGRVSAAFTVPDLAPGSYAVMICDATCARPLAEVIPTRGFTVVADRVTAGLVLRADRLAGRLRWQAKRLSEARADAYRARRAAEDAEVRSEELASDAYRARRAAENAAREIVRVAATSEPRSPWASVAWLVTGTLLGALALLAWRAPPRRRSARESHADAQPLSHDRA